MNLWTHRPIHLYYHQLTALMPFLLASHPMRLIIDLGSGGLGIALNRGGTHCKPHTAAQQFLRALKGFRGSKQRLQLGNQRRKSSTPLDAQLLVLEGISRLCD